MRVAAKRIGSEVYLVVLKNEAQGFVADFNQRTRFPNFNTQSILARGYWEPFEHDEALLERIMRLPKAQIRETEAA